MCTLQECAFLGLMSRACEEVSTNRHLTMLLHALRSAGNFLNRGTALGNASGMAS